MDATLNDTAVIPWLLQKNFTWGIVVTEQSSSKEMKNVWAAGLTPVLDLLANNSTRYRRAIRHKKPFITDLDPILDRYITAAPSGSDLIWIAFIEDDSAGDAYPWDVMRSQPKSRAQALSQFERYVTNSMKETIAWQKLGVQIWARGGFPYSSHVFARAGVDMVLVERANDDVGDINIAIAFARGAARQYDASFGLDLSLWWGVIHGIPNQLPASFHQRHVWATFFSGASVIEVEGGDLLVNSSTGIPNALGRGIAEALQDVSRLFPQGIIPLVNSAIVLPRDSGFIPQPFWATDGPAISAWNFARLPKQPGDAGLDGIFELLFPGQSFASQPWPFGKYDDELSPPSSPFAMTYVQPPFSPESRFNFIATPMIPFGSYNNRDSAKQALNDHNIDPSPYRPIADTAFGHTIDVLTQDVTIDILRKYGIILLAGRHANNNENPQWLERVVTAAEISGAVVIVAAGVVTPEHSNITGVKMGLGKLLVGRAWRQINNNSLPSNWKKEPFMFVPSTINVEQNENIQILAEADDGSPLLVHRTLNGSHQGAIITCLIPWFEGTPGGRRLSGPAEWIITRELNRTANVYLNSSFPIMWMSVELPDNHGHAVLLINNAAIQWVGSIRVTWDSDQCIDGITQNSIPLSDITVTAFSWKIIIC